MSRKSATPLEPGTRSGSPAARGAAPALGKISPRMLEQVILPRLGAPRSDVLVGPGPGRDCAIVRVAPRRVMAVTTDPLSLIPGFGPGLSAWLSCQLLASDLWTSAIPPGYVSLDFNLPPHMTDAEFEEYWQAMSVEWQRLGVAVVSGHTGRFVGCDYSIVGGGTLMGMGDEDGYLSPIMARPGQRVIVTKGCAIAATGIAARMFPKRLGALLGEEGLERARAMIRQMSVVEDCQAALRAGLRGEGVTALHDATEGGVLGGLLELAQACGHAVEVERASIPLLPEARAACQAFGDIDPYWTLSEGALIVCARRERSAAVLRKLSLAGILALEVGEVVPGPPELVVIEPDGSRRRWDSPPADPYWPAYWNAVEQRWE